MKRRLTALALGAFALAFASGLAGTALSQDQAATVQRECLQVHVSVAGNGLSISIASGRFTVALEV